MRPLLTATLFATACSTAPAEPPSDRPLPPCYGTTRDWRAWINAMPGPDRPTLIVQGVVTTPTGNNRPVLTLGPTLRSEPPQQIVNLEIRGLGDIVTNAVTTVEVQGRFPALARYGAIIIHCNGREVGRVSPVETAH